MKKLLYFIVSLGIVGISGWDLFLGPDAPVGTGTLSIGVGDGGGRDARSLIIDEETLAALRYELVLSGPENQTINVSLAAGETFKEQVALGEWRIEAKAFNNDKVLFGEGMTTVRVRAGANQAEVPMTVIVPDTPVSDLDLTELVNAPVSGETPDTTPIATDQYTGSVTWYDEDGTPFSGTFAAATVYHAVVSLTAKSGYVFAGLVSESFIHTGADLITLEAGTETAMTVRIVFRETEAAGSAEYTVTFDKNGGDTEANPTSKTVIYPATTVGTLPAPPTRSGYTFDSWNTQSNGLGTSFTDSTTVSADITVYAQWTANSYTVTFKLNDGTETVYATKTVTTPATTIGAADFPADPSRSGYTFASWNTQPNGSGTPFTATTSVSGDITVYAQWTANSYTVTFKLNDDTGNNHVVKTVTSPATTVTDFPADPTRSGYTFASWNTQPNGSGTSFTDSTTVSANITVYAQWNPGAPVQITLQLDPVDPPLSDAEIFKDVQAVFSAGTGYASWKWYWDGEQIAGETESTYTLAADSQLPGIYELSVVVTTDEDVTLSARCRVTVKAR
jgi:uncharacterized repeat protein (TIGR02543 family)